MIEVDLANWIKAIEAVAAAGGRVYPIFAPAEAAAPYIVYRRLQTQQDYGMEGPSNPVNPTFRLTVWHERYEGAVALGEALRVAIDAYQRGQVAGVQAMSVADRSDAFEPSPELLQRQFYGRQIDLSLRHDE